MRSIKTALISVYDKTGLAPFARGLHEAGIRIISTGQTARELKNAGVPCVEVSEVTAFPEMLDGRVKTLHPRIHAGVLARRGKPEHMRTLREHKIDPIDLVVVGLYPFAEAVRSNRGAEEVIEMIDIGGPALLRAAAKNFESVAAVCDIADYGPVLDELRRNGGSLSPQTLGRLSAKVFQVTSAYDTGVAAYLSRNGERLAVSGEQAFAHRPPPTAHRAEGLPPSIALEFTKVRDLRYGENPHQKGALYRALRAYGPIGPEAQKGEPFDTAQGGAGLADAEVLGGKELSFNNYLDMEAAWALMRAFSETAACVVKHNSPCGVALGKTPAAAFKAAFDCDPLSAFGGIVGVNRKIDAPCAKAIHGAGFLECVVAPDFAPEALEILKAKKNLRLIRAAMPPERTGLDFKRITGGLLVQDRDVKDADAGGLKTATRKKPTAAQIADLLFAFKICRFVKSNAIVLVKGMKTIGIGTGLPSRVDSAFFAFRKAGKKAMKAVMASDGFFPKPDTIQLAARHGISAVIHPGGSIQDAAVIQAADKAKMAMVLTSIRHFTH